MLLRCLILVPAFAGAPISLMLANDTQGFQLPDGAFPHDVGPAPDGNVWLTDDGQNPIVRSTQRLRR
jgi:streptogramin lyase